MGSARFANVGRRVWLALACIGVVYGALLRFDALTQGYGPVARPSWLKDVQERSRPLLAAIRPDSLRWDPVPLYPHRDGPPTHYFSDPYTYLKYARDMSAFSAAHHREPVFPYATSVFLRLLDDQDVAVSFASAMFSVLAVFATYLLGVAAFSRSVGVLAALGMAIEYELISLSVGGWRDDAFMFAIVLCACAMVRYIREASRKNAALVGLCAGFVCLVRLTSVSFLVPAVLYLLFTTKQSWRERTKLAGVAALVTAVVVAPYILNCWRVYGDPLYAINYHTQGQLAMETRISDRSPFANRLLAPPMPDLTSGQPASVEAAPARTAVSYVGTKVFSRPFETLDTIAMGMTTYPFLNKWTGFNRWAHSLGRWLSWASLAGLLLFVGSPYGRLFLIVLASSLIPFAATWKLASDWRFTAYTYPFFLLAAALAVERAVAPLLRRTYGGADLQVGPSVRRRLVFWSTVVAIAVVGSWTVAAALPPLVVRETLGADEDVSIMAGERDLLFFRSGWSSLRREGNLTFRVATGAHAAVALPLPRAIDYSVTVRLDPFPRPTSATAVGLPTIAVTFNGQPVARFNMRWNEARVGAYDLTLPKTLVRPGFNRLELSNEQSTGGPAGPGFKLWYVRVRPLTPEAKSDPSMAVDTPGQDAVFELGQRFPLTGWAVDRGGSTGPGVTVVRAYAFPLSAGGLGPGVRLGDATLGRPRPDIAQLFGRQFEPAGFALDVSGLPAGRFRLGVYASSVVTGTFNQSRFVDVTIAPR